MKEQMKVSFWNTLFLLICVFVMVGWCFHFSTTIMASPASPSSTKPTNLSDKNHHHRDQTKGVVTAEKKPTSRPISQDTDHKRSVARPSATADKAKQAEKPSASEQDCETGCGSQGHIRKPTVAQLRLLLRQYAKEPLQAGSSALETLLFFGETTRSLLARLKTTPLPSKHKQFLERELQQKYAWISVRIRDHLGKHRVLVAPHRVEIGHHFHLHADVTHEIQAPSFGGRAERVGLKHLWIRI